VRSGHVCAPGLREKNPTDSDRRSTRLSAAISNARRAIAGSSTFTCGCSREDGGPECFVDRHAPTIEILFSQRQVWLKADLPKLTHLQRYHETHVPDGLTPNLAALGFELGEILLGCAAGAVVPGQPSVTDGSDEPLTRDAVDFRLVAKQLGSKGNAGDC
jgi:hypothetical protein